MSIATEILGLRRDRSSSVQNLIALLDWQHAAPNADFAAARAYAAAQAADTVLLNVAVHALEALDKIPQTPKARRAIRALFRRRRGSDAPKLKQRIRRSFA